MRRLFFLAVLGVGALSLDVTPAGAQVAGAIGKPLSSPDLPAGTISVRVVAGSVSVPVVNTEVTLLVNGTPRLARTDSAGRAQFKDLPVGATVQAKVTDEDKKEITSDEFPVPTDNGARVMISTKPFVPMGGGGGGMNGAMPEPRQMSGEPRQEQSDAPGTYTVRLTYDDFKDAPPVDVPVALVGYTAKDDVEIRVGRSDKDGRASFAGLDRTGAVSYFAMAQLPRGNAIDRLVSTPSVLDSRSGVRLVLSADKRASTGPAVDDIVRLEKQDNVPAAGKVRVTLEGVPEATAEVHLMAIHAKPTGDAAPVVRELGHLRPIHSAPNPQDIQATSEFQPKADVPAHQVNVQFHGGAGVNEPIVGASIRLVPAKPKDGAPPDTTAPVKTPTDGYVELTNASNEPLIAEIEINGKQMKSQPFDLSTKGGYLDVAAQWDPQGKLWADFDVADVKPDEVLYAETKMRNTVYRSVPFQTVADRGTRVTLYIYPRIMFSFSLTAHIDDNFLAVSGRFDVSNNSWAPYIGGTDGLVIPLPKHFKGAIVAEQDQGDVAVAQGEGYRIGRPIPPGGKQFHGAFSLPVEQGNVEWAMDLPLGAFQSGMEIMQTPGMSVQLPPSVKGQTMTVPQGTFFVLPSISILPKQSMVMTISGLPSQPSWRLWAPRLVGVGAVLLMLGGLAFALHRTQTARATDAVRGERRAKLLDELVELEKAKDVKDGGKDAKRRAQITAELEELWDDAT